MYDIYVRRSHYWTGTKKNHNLAETRLPDTEINALYVHAKGTFNDLEKGFSSWDDYTGHIFQQCHDHTKYPNSYMLERSQLKLNTLRPSLLSQEM